MNDDKSRARLGRGLASLIGGGGAATGARPAFFGPAEAAPLAAAASGERLVAIQKLAPNPRNPRRAFHEAELEELSASIRVHGVVQPILVRRRTDEPGAFEIVAGERRWRAAKAVGLAEVPVVLREISDRESLEIAIIENVQRADLNAIEEAQGYQMLIDEHGYTQADLGEVLGKSRSYVANTLRLLKLPGSVREMVMRGELTPGAARTVVSSTEPEIFARRIVEEGLSVREAEEVARRSVASVPDEAAGLPRRPGPARNANGAKDSDKAALEQLLTEALQMPVAIKLSGGGGRLSLDFASLDQLDEICRLLQAGHAASERTPRIRSL